MLIGKVMRKGEDGEEEGEDDGNGNYGQPHRCRQGCHE